MNSERVIFVQGLIVNVYKMHVPKHIYDYFNVNADFHNYNTRHASLLLISGSTYTY